MKKVLIIFLFAIFLLLPAFSQNLDQLYGIWEGEDRFVFIEPPLSENEQAEVVILLKEFYGWYYDRVSEPKKYSESHKRVRNSATTKNAEHVLLTVQPVRKSSCDNTFELVLTYKKNQQSVVPVVVINDNMFLDFYVRDSEDKNFYRGVAQSKGIMASQQSVNKNLTSYYLSTDFIYNIRYWITDMDYSDSKVELKQNKESLKIDRHIFSGNNNYTCVAGRRNVIRNAYIPEQFNKDNYYFTEDESVMLIDKDIYLTRLTDKDNFNQLMEIVLKANSRRKPEPEPLFPDSDLDFHWEIIDMLEKDVKLIQEVRVRQEAFGPRSYRKM